VRKGACAIGEEGVQVHAKVIGKGKPKRIKIKEARGWHTFNSDKK
jgi:hypothetical protein